MPRGMTAEEVEVFRGAAAFGRREFIESILREEGIRYVVRSEGGIAEHPITVGPMGEFVVLVSPGDADRVRALLAQVESATPLDADDEGVEEDTPPRTLLGIRPPSPREQRAFLVFGVASAAGGLALILWAGEKWTVIGIVLLVVFGPLMIARSR